MVVVFVVVVIVLVIVLVVVVMVVVIVVMIVVAVTRMERLIICSFNQFISICFLGVYSSFNSECLKAKEISKHVYQSRLIRRLINN